MPDKPGMKNVSSVVVIIPVKTAIITPNEFRKGTSTEARIAQRMVAITNQITIDLTEQPLNSLTS